MTLYIQPRENGAMAAASGFKPMEQLYTLETIE
jgi:hypothetical protein